MATPMALLSIFHYKKGVIIRISCLVLNNTEKLSFQNQDAEAKSVIAVLFHLYFGHYSPLLFVMCRHLHAVTFPRAQPSAHSGIAAVAARLKGLFCYRMSQVLCSEKLPPLLHGGIGLTLTT